MTTIVLTQPASSSGGIPGITIPNVLVPYNTTTMVDSCICPASMSVKWFYTIKDSIDQTVVSAEILAHHNYGNDVEWNWYGLIGNIDTMKHKIDVSLTSSGGSPFVGDTINLNITNNDVEGNDWNMSIIRIQMVS